MSGGELFTVIVLLYKEIKTFFTKNLHLKFLYSTVSKARASCFALVTYEECNLFDPSIMIFGMMMMTARPIGKVKIFVVL